MSHSVLLVDDSEADRDLYCEFLGTDGHLDVTAISPASHPKMSDYGSLLAEQFEAVILDNRMNQEAGVPFNGAELAEYLRQVDPGVPIFILSNYAEEAESTDQSGVSESIINKNALHSGEDARKYIARILRAIGKFQEARTETEKRIDDLIARKLEGSISEAENEELEHWRTRVAAPASEEAMVAVEGADKMVVLEHQLQKLMDRLEKLPK